MKLDSRLDEIRLPFAGLQAPVQPWLLGTTRAQHHVQRPSLYLTALHGLAQPQSLRELGLRDSVGPFKQRALCSPLELTGFKHAGLLDR